MSGAQAQPKPRGQSPLSPTVLLVEDEAAICQVLVRQLHAGGYRVIPAASSDEALAILTDRGATVQILLTDVMMPGLIGPQLVAIMHLRWPAVQPVCTTGGAVPWATELMRDSRAPRLQKPFTAAQLQDALQTLVPQAAGARE
jgi:two-component system, cell cycle sensor histidine kinase and response regulator CckA